MKIVSLLLAALMSPALVLAQSDPKSNTNTPPSTTGGEVSGPRPMNRVSGRVYVGERAPDFSLWSSRDRELKLSQYRGTWVLVAFFDRREDVGEYRAIHRELDSLGVHLLPVSHEKAHALRGYVQREDIPFEILADVTGEIAALYGLYDSEHRQIRPGFLVLDRMGMVRLAFLGQSLPHTQVMELVRLTMVGL